jgi:hypothetical protein
MIGILGDGCIHSLILFIYCLNNIHEYSPLHDIILRTIQTPQYSQ